MPMWFYLLLNALVIGGFTYQWGFGGFLGSLVGSIVFFALFMKKR